MSLHITQKFNRSGGMVGLEESLLAIHVCHWKAGFGVESNCQWRSSICDMKPMEALIALPANQKVTQRTAEHVPHHQLKKT